MSVYNRSKYLREAIDSILSQTLMSFEFIIIDDGSTDGTWDILTEYADQDQRIALVQNRKNLGLSQSLNKGLVLAQGNYIARQDADDVSLPERLEKQVGFLDEHPEVEVLGTWIAHIDEQGKHTGIWKTPTSPALVRWFLSFRNCIAHPSVTFRRSLIEQGELYRSEIAYAQDYDLWVRLSAKTHLTNFPEILCLRRVHEDMIGAKYSEQQNQTAQVVMQQAITRVLEKEVSDTRVAKLWHSSCGRLHDTAADLEAAVSLVLDLYRVFIGKEALVASELTEVRKDAARRLKDLALSHAVKLPVAARSILWQSILLDRRLPLITCFKMMYRLLGMKLRKT
jgi:hypothetical protein